MGRTRLWLTIAGTSVVTGAVCGVSLGGVNNNTCQIMLIRRNDSGLVECQWGFLVNSMSSGSGSNVNGHGRCGGLRIIVRRKIKKLAMMAVLPVRNPAFQVSANRLGKFSALVEANRG